MDELLELIARIGTDDPPTDEELARAREELVGLLRVATAEETRDLESAGAIREAIDAVDAESTARVEAHEAEEAEARRLLEGLDPPSDDTGDDDDAGDAASGDGGEAAGETQAGTESEREPVAAAAGARRNLSAALRRTQARMTADDPTTSHPARVITLGAAQAERLGQDATLSDVARVFDRAASRVKSPGDRQSFVRIEWEYPEVRRLLGTERYDNDRLLDQVAGAEAIAAAGGVCDPLPADFTHPILGQRGRPIRGSLPRFLASRGGVRFSPAATLAAVAGAVGVWTHEIDTSPGEQEKACLVVECEDESVAYVDAITACLQIGNFQARFNQELWRSRLNLLMISHDRLAEQTLWAQMDAASVQVTYGAGNGTIYSVLSGIDKAVAGLRSRLRLGMTVIRSVAPEWVRAALRADIASQKLGSSPAEALSIADNIINTFFTVRGIRPVWSQDLEVFAAQTTGALQEWPGGDVEVLVFPEGTFFFLDGGTLDLGTEIFDSTLIRQNNRMAFLETFERAVFRGGQSLALTVPVAEMCVCPDIFTVEPNGG